MATFTMLTASPALPRAVSRPHAALSMRKAMATMPMRPVSQKMSVVAQRRSMTIMNAIKVGDAAPDFTLMGSGFTDVTLSKYKGKKVVLAFFPAAFSGDENGGCQCQLNALKGLSKMDGVTVIGISKDHPFALAGWEAAFGYDFRCLSDLNLDVSKKYVGTFDLGKFLDGLGISKRFTPYEASNRGCIVIDEQGNVVYTWVGQDASGPRPDLLPDVAAIKAALGIMEEKESIKSL